MSSLIQYCPACGRRSFEVHSSKSFLCTHCDFVLYLNAAAAVAAIIESEGDILLTVRASEPGQGMLDLPGGFVDHHETLEEALIRELKEELGLDLTLIGGDRLSHQLPAMISSYIGSFPNTYRYRGVTYETVDMFYTIRIEPKPTLIAKDDVADWVWVPKNLIPMEKIAFASAQNILRYCYPQADRSVG